MSKIKSDLKKSVKMRLDDLVGIEMENLLDEAVLNELRDLTLETGREILIGTSDKNRILWVNIGDAANVSVGDSQMESYVKSLNRYRVIHTHPGGNPRLSAEDFSAAKAQWLQCIVAVGVDEKTPSLFGMGIPMVAEDKIIYRQGYFNSLKKLNAFPLEQFILKANRFIKNDPNRIYESENEEERVLLLGLSTASQKGMDIDESMSELAQLVLTAGGTVLETVTQNRSQIDPTFYLGRGKIQEITKIIQNNDINMIVTNDELNARQIHNIEALTSTKTIDRTTVILDIFAKHASTREGKLQVELAQQKYRMSHLKGLGIVMSRTGGGIGTRGPGEKKLETDRRHIRKQIEELEAKKKKIEKSNELNAVQRQKNLVKTVSLIGYTNSGKSTLFNRLTASQAVMQDGLFITLDSTMRKVSHDKHEYLISDTVGFIDKLPHDLVNAFKTTLKEVEMADLLLHVVDVSNPHFKEQIEVVNGVLKELNVVDRPILLVYNKIDQLTVEMRQTLAPEEEEVFISAKEGIGIDVLFEKVDDQLLGMRREETLLIPYEDTKTMAFLHEKKVVLELSYEEAGSLVQIEVTDDFPLHRVEKYLIVKES
ncbi:GTPase HflX [Eubacteriaceae bacterium ES3]|nr:GTPase HflX [Eubacteriaceae bacterium ES3]